MVNTNSKDMETENLVAKSVLVFMDRVKAKCTREDQTVWNAMIISGLEFQAYRKFLLMGQAWVEALLLNENLHIDDVVSAQRTAHEFHIASTTMTPTCGTVIHYMRQLLALVDGEDSFAMRALGHAIQDGTATA